MEQTDQSKETYTLVYLKNGQYKLRYENDNFGKQVTINNGNITIQSGIWQDLQEGDVNFDHPDYQYMRNFNAYIPLGLKKDEVINYFIQKTFEELWSYENVYTFLGCTKHFVDNFRVALLLKKCGRNTAFAGCIKKYFLTWDQPAYFKDIELLGLSNDEKLKFNVITQNILMDLIPIFCSVLSKKIKKNLCVVILKEGDEQKAVSFLINKFTSYRELPNRNTIEGLFECTQFTKEFKQIFILSQWPVIFIEIIKPLFKLLDGIKCLSGNTKNNHQIWQDVQKIFDAGSNVLADETDQLPIATAEDIPNNNSTCIFVLQKMLYEDNNLNFLDTSMISLDEYVCCIKYFLRPLKVINVKEVKKIKVLCGPDLYQTLYTLRESFPEINTVEFVDNGDAINAITDNNWQNCLKNIFYKNLNKDTFANSLTFAPLDCYFPSGIFEKMQDKKKNCQICYAKNVQKDSIVCVRKSVYEAASVAFFLMMAWHLLVTPKNKHFLFKTSLYGLYYYFLQFNKFKPLYYTAACHIPIAILLACYGQWDALPNVFKLPHAKGFIGFATPLSFIFYFANSLRFYRDRDKIIDNSEMQTIITNFDKYIKKKESISDAT